MQYQPPNPLACWMARHDYEAQAVAEWLGISRAMMSRLLRGERQASPDLLSRIVTVTGGDVTPNAWVAWAAAQGREEAADT